MHDKWMISTPFFPLINRTGIESGGHDMMARHMGWKFRSGHRVMSSTLYSVLFVSGVSWN